MLVSLRQGTLQIEAGIGRLLRRDRTVGKKAASEHVIAGAVDGFDADELPGLVAKGGERALPAIARTTTRS